MVPLGLGLVPLFCVEGFVGWCYFGVGFFFIALKKTWNLAELEIPESSQLQLFCCALLLLHPQWRCQGRNVVHTSLLQYCTKAAGQSHFELDLTENTNCILILACPCSPVTLWSWVNSAVSLDVALTHGGYRTLWCLMQDYLLWQVLAVLFAWMSPETSQGAECIVGKPWACCEWMDLALGETN